MQSEITELSTVLFQDCKYLVWRLVDSNDQIVSGLVMQLVEEGRQAKVTIYKESHKSSDAYANIWQTRVNVLSEAVAHVVRPGNDVQAAPNVPATSAPEAQTGSRSQVYPGKAF